MAGLAGRVSDEPAAEGETEWPDESEEASFLSEAAARGERVPPAAPGIALPGTGEKLPALEELVGQVPSAVRELLDDLFRAKFTGVRKYAAVAASAPEAGSER